MIVDGSQHKSQWGVVQRVEAIEILYEGVAKFDEILQSTICCILILDYFHPYSHVLIELDDFERNLNQS